MRNKTNIVVGVLVFLLVLTSPIWLNLGKSAEASQVEVSLDTPTINTTQTTCSKTTWKSSISGKSRSFVTATEPSSPQTAANLK